MVNGRFNFAARAIDFRLQGSDAGLELIHGKRVEILQTHERERIILALRKIVVCIHG
ncbi:hypothetical protein ACFB49_15670 [Sphingomonas sp. DBB INV C78]